MDLRLSEQEILALLKKGSRQALAIPEEERLAIQSKPFTAPYLKTLQEYAENVRGKVIPSLQYSDFRLFYDTGNRAQYEDGERGYFPRRGRLAAFGMLSWLYGRKEDLAELCDILWAVCDEYTWAVPAHLVNEAKRSAFVDKL